MIEEAMNPEAQKLRDELLYDQVKGTRSLSLGLAIVYGACTVLTVAFAVGIVALGKGIKPLLVDLGMMAASAAAALQWWKSFKSCVAALAEIGDDPTGIDTCKTYSQATAEVIAGSRKSRSELKQQWIAYGILALVMLLCGVFFVALLQEAGGDELLFGFCTAFMLAGGVLLSSLSIRAWREWLVARRLDRLEQ